MTASLTELRAAREKEAAAADLAAKEAAVKEAIAALSIKAANEAAWAAKNECRRSAPAPQVSSCASSSWEASSSASSSWEAPQATPPQLVPPERPAKGLRSSAAAKPPPGPQLSRADERAIEETHQHVVLAPTEREAVRDLGLAVGLGTRKVTNKKNRRQGS